MGSEVQSVFYCMGHRYTNPACGLITKEENLLTINDYNQGIDYSTEFGENKKRVTAHPPQETRENADIVKKMTSGESL